MTGEISETNILPSKAQTHKYMPTNDSNVKHLTEVVKVYEDLRYKAKLRLYNYVTYTKKGLEIPMYTPFANTEIGKSTPILSF